MFVTQTLLKVTSEQALTLQQLREIGCTMEEPETDHKPLECIFLPKCKTCTRIKRWLLRMQPYRFTVKYIPGPKNIADSLSHLLHPVPQSRDQNKTEEYVKWIAQESMPVALTTVKLREYLNMTHS